MCILFVPSLGKENFRLMSHLCWQRLSSKSVILPKGHQTPQLGKVPPTDNFIRSDKSDWSIVKKQLDINKHTVYTQGLWRLVLFTEFISRHWSFLLDLIIEALNALTHFPCSGLEAIFSQTVSSTIIFLCRHLALFIYIIQLLKPFLKF